ncbi:MAG: cytochrome c biogenesis CcdA family protein [Clostridiaceae bacterium]
MKWVLKKMFNNFINALNTNILLSLIIAFLAGLVSSFSPCILSTLPLIIGFNKNKGVNEKRTAFKYSLYFSLGLIMTFTIMGIIVSFLGRILVGLGGYYLLILGIIMIISGLQILEMIKIRKDSCKIPKKNNGFISAFFLGILGGALASPCATPVLSAILAFAAGKSNILFGGLLLLFYSIGYSIVIIIAGTSIGVVESLNNNPKTKKIGNILKNILGIIVILLGLYLVYLSK